MKVEVVVPWMDAGCSHREAAWTFVEALYARKHPEWQITRAEPVQRPQGEHSPDTARTWIKADAVNPAVAASDADVVVMADADVWCDGIPAAIDALGSEFRWAVPHRGLFRLNKEASAQVFTGAPLSDALALEERSQLGTIGGGIVVAEREALLEAPMDPRFVGWGQEDTCWAHALTCLVGPNWRPTGYSPLFHFHHPPQARMSRAVGSPAGRRLHRRYAAARRDPAQMRRLIEEVSDAPGKPHQPPLHADPQNLLR